MEAETAPRVPRHIAIVMDGNGRWAERRRRPRSFGHREGQKAVRAAVEFCLRRGVEALTLFAFSPSCETCLPSSLRRSSVSGGRLMRMTLPTVVGVKPRSEARIAFSTAPTMFFSYGVIVIERASATATFATCMTGVSVP